MAQVNPQNSAAAPERLSRRHMLTFAGLGALIPGAALLARLTGHLASPTIATQIETAHPLKIVEALPRFAGASLVGQKAVLRNGGGIETPAAYLYFHTSERSWQEIRSFYERTLPSLGWAVRRNDGTLGGLGFSRGGYSGFLASTPLSSDGSPATYYLFLGALS